MVTHPSVPANNVREFIDYLKANPDKVAYASAGQGSTNHLSAALFEKAAGVKMVHVPYRGGAPAVLDTVAGRNLFSAGTQTLPCRAASSSCWPSPRNSARRCCRARRPWPRPCRL